MAEDEVSYASVLFKAKQDPRPEAEPEEETLYAAVQERSVTTDLSGDTTGSAGLLPDKNQDRLRRPLVWCLGASCAVLLSVIIAVGVYLTTLSPEQNQLKENQTSLLTVNDNLTTEIHQLKEKIQKLEAHNQELKTNTTKLETKITNMTEDIQINNVSRAQWSINAYCPKEGTAERECKPCRDKWLNFTTDCYAINNPSDSAKLKTWEEAAADCRGKNSHLAVIETQGEKDFVTGKSWKDRHDIRYWIGLRAEGGKWTWINGEELKQGSWISGPAVDGQCATSLQGRGWLSESCTWKRRWICEQAAVTV